jgi:hypothetical protein
VKQKTLPLSPEPGGVMDVQYFYSFARDSVEDLVRIPNERNDSHTGALSHLFRAHWPPADAALNASKSCSNAGNMLG